jgi:hypothetical protein
VILAFALPAALVTGWYAKNFVLFGQATASSWYGMNLARVTTFNLPDDELRRLVARKEIPPVAAYPPFMPNYDLYERLLGAPKPSGVPVLDQKLRSNGQTNYNNPVYIAASRAYLRAALTVIARYPLVYAEAVVLADTVWFKPASHYFLLKHNLRRIETWDRLYDFFVYGSFAPHAGDANSQKIMDAIYPKVGWFIFAAYAAALFFGWRLVRGGFAGGPPDAATLTLLFLWTTLVYVWLTGNLMELGENERFRFYTEPLVVAIVAAWFAGKIHSAEE